MNFDLVFSPHSIALVGASRDALSVGAGLLKNLSSTAYKGSVYPVNPKATDIQGIPCFASLNDIPSQIDLVIIAIPAPFVQKVVEEAVALGIKAIIIISAGFKEQGTEGKEREELLSELCRKNDIALVGPNCLGILNPHIGLNASFETVLPIKGSIACISQSGALISSLLDIANERGIGFSKIISVGNKALVTENNLLPYLLEDPYTKVITIYTESLSDAPFIINTLRQNQTSPQPKPIIMLKAGVTEEGQHASSSHTGSLAGSDMAYDALCNQAGIIRVRSMDELLTTAHIFASNPLPAGNKVTIVTNAGGPGILATDEASRLSLSLSHFSDETNKKLTEILPPNAHPANPVDLLGDATHERYQKALEIVASDPEVDSMVVIVTPQTMTDIPETAASIIHIRNNYPKPIVVSFIGDEQVESGQMILSSAQIAHSQFPEPAVTSLGHLTTFAEIIASRRTEDPPTHTQINFDHIPLPPHTQKVLLDTDTVFTILQHAHIPVVPWALSQSPHEAREKALHINKPLAMKVVSREISHKTDVGGVLLNIKPEEADSAFRTILDNIRKHVPQAKTEGILLTEMISGEGCEFYIGVKKEAPLGTLIIVGLGGIYVEIIKDVSSGFAPLSINDIETMILSLKGASILKGVRGKPPLDIQALSEMVLNVSHLALSLPGIVELDINPVFVKPKNEGAVVLDARIVME